MIAGRLSSLYDNGRKWRVARDVDVTSSNPSYTKFILYPLKYHCICIRIIFKGYSKMSPIYSVRKVGQPNTLQHRIYIEQNGAVISAFHDVPLYADSQQNTLHMVVEIPRWTNSKFEVSR